MSCLISFVWSSLGCEQRSVSENFKMIMYASAGNRTRNPLLFIGEEHTNEIKRDIHPELWVHRDRFNIKTNMAAVYMTTGQL